jgi:hypothetical protein
MLRKREGGRKDWIADVARLLVSTSRSCALDYANFSHSFVFSTEFARAILLVRIKIIDKSYG